MIRGTTIDAARRFLLQSQGTPAYDELVEQLTPEQRALIDRPIKPSDWFPADLYIGVLDKAAETVAGDDPAGYLARLGRFVLDDGVTSLYRAFFRIATPGFVIRGSALLWGMFFKGNKLKILESKRRSVSAAILDSPVNSHNLCQSIVGGMQASLEHAGAKNVRYEMRNCGAGKPSDGKSCAHCDFHFTWTKR